MVVEHCVGAMLWPFVLLYFLPPSESVSLPWALFRENLPSTSGSAFLEVCESPLVDGVIVAEIC
jgi:hypothetical protein